MLCRLALSRVRCGQWFQSRGWVVRSLGFVPVLFTVLSRLWERENGASPSFSFPFLNEWFSRREVFLFKKNQCSHRRSNFFITFLRKSRLDLKLLILVSRWAAGRKTGRTFGRSFGKLLTFFFFRKKM